VSFYDKLQASIAMRMLEIALESGRAWLRIMIKHYPEPDLSEYIYPDNPFRKFGDKEEPKA
jgi:hypothetical protein